MDKKTKTRIKNKLREIHKWDGDKDKAKKRCKVDKGLYECEHCKIKLYEGKSMKNFEAYQEVYGEKVIWNNIEMDHIIPISEKAKSWDEYIDSLFCQPEGYQGLCKSCHHIKTNEDKNRKKT